MIDGSDFCGQLELNSIPMVLLSQVANSRDNAYASTSPYQMSASIHSVDEDL